jgi:NADH-quinone oxidoreductase subunit E
MSVRRLAEDTVQPVGFKFSRSNASVVKQWIAKYPKGRQASAVIPLLMIAQEQEGWVTKAAIEHVAETLQMPFIRVLEVATFYTQFMLSPVGTKAHIQVCGTTPCMLRGADELKEVCRKKIHPEQFHTNYEGTLSWEEVECQGACVNAPMVMIFKDTYEDLTPERLEEIIDAFDAGKSDSVTPGPQIDRIYSAPEGALTSLLEEVQIKSGAEKSGSSKYRAKTPPAKAGRPKPAALETSGAIETPSKAKGPGVKKDAGKNRPAAPSNDDKNRPAAMKRPANPDDLKLIAGVGPKIERTLNDLGVFTFEQISNWKKAEREWVDGYLKFHGRIERDDWIKQAKALAKGGAAEYIKVFGKKPR